MENQCAKFFLSISDWTIEISGNEKFVKEQIDKFDDYLISIFDKITSDKIKEDVVNSKTMIQWTNWNYNQDISMNEKKWEPVINDDKEWIINEYKNVFHEDEWEIKIICDINNSSNAQSTYDIAMMYAFINHSDWWAIVDDIKNICIDHGCRDQKNFSTHIKKGNPKFYTDKWKWKDRRIKLTYPWREEAKKIISKYNWDNE